MAMSAARAQVWIKERRREAARYAITSSALMISLRCLG
jgi:hypothetical protein